MKTKWSTVCAAVLAAGVVCTSPASAQVAVVEAPATLTGTATCEAKFPGSFLDIRTAACWQCPTTHPNRTVFFPVTVPNACERPAPTVFSTPAWTRATRKGSAGCPTGSFRHGLTDRCYSCPAGYVRNAVIADDLTKVKACTRIPPSVREATRAKFEQQKNAYPATRANLATIAVNPAGVGGPGSDSASPSRDDKLRYGQMKRSLSNEIERGSRFYVITWVFSGGGSFGGAGYYHGEGFAMTKVNEAYRCRKFWSNTFIAGASASAGAAEEVSLSWGSELVAETSESNGWQIGIGAGLSAGLGMGWDAKSGAPSVSATFGVSKVGVGGEYVHTWSETGKEVDCDTMTWGPGWKDL